MITVLIRVKHGPEALAVTLSALVPAVADGLVADAVMLVSKADDTIASVAEAVGATLVVSARGDWLLARIIAKRDWLLCLDDGDMPRRAGSGPSIASWRSALRAAVRPPGTRPRSLWSAGDASSAP